MRGPNKSEHGRSKVLSICHNTIRSPCALDSELDSDAAIAGNKASCLLASEVNLISNGRSLSGRLAIDFSGRLPVFVCSGGCMNKRIVTSLILLSFFVGAWPVSAADEIDVARQERDARSRSFLTPTAVRRQASVFLRRLCPGRVVLNVHGAPVYAGIRHVGDTQQTESATEMRWRASAQSLPVQLHRSGLR